MPPNLNIVKMSFEVRMICSFQKVLNLWQTRILGIIIEILKLLNLFIIQRTEGVTNAVTKNEIEVQEFMLNQGHGFFVESDFTALGTH